VEYDTFATGDGAAVRNEMNIPADAFVLGHVGRLAPEKNLSYLTETVAEYLKQDPESYFLVVGDGPSREEMEVIFRAADVSDRVRFAGVQKDQALVDSYHAMDLKVFASKSETQGMVLAEAMAAGLPVVALKASGVNDILKSGENGILIKEEDRQEFRQAITEIRNLNDSEWKSWQQAIDQTAHEFSAKETSEKVFTLYEDLYQTGHKKHLDDEAWDKLMRAIKREWEIWERRLTAGAQSITRQKPPE
jgi:glycosyltransferase involved in cell wall biosynthesis